MPSTTDPKSDHGESDSPLRRTTSLPSFDLPSEGEIDLGALEASDGVVNLDALPEAPSGHSLTSWTAIIRRQQQEAHANGADAIKVDAPSDRDLLAKVDAPPAPPPAAPGDVPLALPTGHSESDIDLGLGRAGIPTGPATGGESAVKFDVLFPPSDAGGAMPAPGGEAPLSAVDFRSAAAQLPAGPIDVPFAVAADTSPSGVDLGKDDDEPHQSDGRSSILDVLLKEAGGNGPPSASESADVLNYGVAPVKPARPTAPTADHPAITTQPGIDMAGRPEEGGRELVGSKPEMGSDEAIDLLAGPSAEPNITDSGTLEISEEVIEQSARKAEIIESSSVDLNSRPQYAPPGSEFDVALDALTEDDESASGIDLNLPATEQDAAGSSMIYPKPAADPALAAELEARRKTRKESAPQPVPEAEEVPSAKTVKAPKSAPPDVFPAKRVAVPRRQAARPARSGRTAIIAASVGLLFGVAGMFGAYYAHALPDRTADKLSSADLSILRKHAFENKHENDQLKKYLADAGVDMNHPAEGIKELGNARAQSNARVKAAMAETERLQIDLAAARQSATNAKSAEQSAKASLTEAQRAATAAKKDLADANKALDAAKAEVAAVKATGGAVVAEVATALKDAGLDPAKPGEGLRQLTAARAAAEAKEKEASTKLAEATKKVTDLTALADVAKKSADDARKAAEDAAKARDASDATVKAIADRLAKAKLVGANADSVALLRGIDDALKAGSGDATQALREELASARQQEAKVKADLAAAREKEAETAKVAAAATAEAKKLATDLARAKTATDRATEAEREAALAKEAADKAAVELTRLRVENDRLARDLEAVKELADLIKTPAIVSTGPVTRPDPARLAEQFFGDGLRAYHGGRHPEAESAFRKAIQFRPADARFHYLLGLTLWARNDTPGAEAEFEKGRDLESQSRPSSRLVGATLERIQGPARQAVDAYRP
jgi:hypothetical protein